jgi:aminoglycoside phosphotransferase (APT) family kinase protein
MSTRSPNLTDALHPSVPRCAKHDRRGSVGESARYVRYNPLAATRYRERHINATAAGPAENGKTRDLVSFYDARVDSDVIDTQLVRRLVASQFPRWASLPLRPVTPQGVDNRTFRLGTDLSVRLPTGDWYALQVEKEQRWLPTLAPQLPLPIPEPVAQGVPALGYPYPWSVYRWIDGIPAIHTITDWSSIASTLAKFLAALQRVDYLGGPEPGLHNFFRGSPLRVYTDQTAAAIDTLGAEIDRAAVERVWNIGGG